MFRFEQKHRRVSIRDEGSQKVVEIEPSWQLWKIALAFGTALYAINEAYLFATYYLRPGRFGLIAGVMPIAELISIGLALVIAKDAAFDAMSKEEVRITPQSDSFVVTTQLLKVKHIRDFPINEVRNLHSLESSWYNQRENTGIEFYDSKYGYRFAQGASREDRAKIIKLLEQVGVSTLDRSVPSTAYSPSTPPQ